MSTKHDIHATTILCVRRGAMVAMGGDGQVTMGQVVAKSDAVKVRKLESGMPGSAGGSSGGAGSGAYGSGGAGVLIGFAGAAADAFALVDKFEAKLKESPGNVKKAAIELAKLWRTDRMLRRLESLLAVADRTCSLIISGSGDVIEPSDGVVGIGSGGAYAVAAARALLGNTQLPPRQVIEQAMAIAGDLCIYTNRNVTVVELA